MVGRHPIRQLPGPSLERQQKRSEKDLEMRIQGQDETRRMTSVRASRCILSSAHGLAVAEAKGTKPVFSTIFWPASDLCQSMYFFMAPWGSPRV